jgi:hypothetical protein
MMPYNPPYYIPLIESCGFSKEKDLISLLIVQDDRASQRMERLAARIKKRTNVRIRHGRKKDFESEMALIGDIYLSAWSKNWGFVPMTAEEIREAGKNLARIIDEELVFFLYYEDEPVGVIMILPDINPLLRHFDGKIGLRGLYHILFHKHEVKGLRGVLFGVKKRYQKLGLPVVAFDHLNKVLRGRTDYEYLEFGWNLEDNDAINKFEIEAGAKIRNRYRIYRRAVAGTANP